MIRPAGLIFLGMLLCAAVLAILAITSRAPHIDHELDRSDADGMAAFIALGCQPSITDTGALVSGCDKIRPLE